MLWLVIELKNISIQIARTHPRKSCEGLELGHSHSYEETALALALSS